MTKNELNLDELNKVAGGMIKCPGLPTGTGPTFPFPFPIPFIPLGPFRF